MTQPPLDPASRTTGDASPTEPVPAPDPALVEPPAPAAPRVLARSSRALTLALGAALLAAAVGVAFAVGRVSAPGTSQAGAAGNAPGFDGGNRSGANGHGPLANGGGTMPDSSFDPKPGGANGGFPGDGDNDGFGRGLGRGGFGGMGITGTVKAVTDTSITIETANGLTVTIGRDGTTTYHQQAPAQASDVTTGDKVHVQVSGGHRPQQGTDGNVTLGTAGDITIVP